MFKVSLHNHTNLSDGIDNMEDLILGAIDKGFTHLGITDHVSTYAYEQHSLRPEKYEDYINKINFYKEKYKEKIEIFAGMETEYYGIRGSLMSDINSVRDKLDYTVGSVHVVCKKDNIYAVDESRESFINAINEDYNGDAKEFVLSYFDNYIKNLNYNKPEVAGHIDLIKKNNENNEFFDENDKWYKDTINDTLNEIKKIDAVLEINTGGGYKHGIRCIYPSLEILRLANEKDIKITLSSDAHNIDMLDYYYDNALEMLKKTSINKIYTYSNKEKGFISFYIK